MTRDKIKVLNVCSLQNVIDELKYLILTKNIDAIAVTETFRYDKQQQTT